MLNVLPPQTIEKQGFAPVRMDVLLRLPTLESLSDTVRNILFQLVEPAIPQPFRPLSQTSGVVQAKRDSPLFR